MKLPWRQPEGDAKIEKLIRKQINRKWGKMTGRIAVLFVCLGNICRSPLAEAAFRREAERYGVDADVDSAGTGAWHVGEAPDRRAQSVAKRHGIDIRNYRARLIKIEDFYDFTHIVALDFDNLASLQAMKPMDATASLSLLLDHVEGRRGEAVGDPYYGGDDGFDITWEEVTLAARGLVCALTEQK